jgi:hypothetical protein
LLLLLFNKRAFDINDFPAFEPEVKPLVASADETPTKVKKVRALVGNNMIDRMDWDSLFVILLERIIIMREPLCFVGSRCIGGGAMLDDGGGNNVESSPTNRQYPRILANR